MRRNLFALVLGAYLLIAQISAWPTLNFQLPTELKSATESNLPPTAFQRETNELIRSTWSNTVKNALIGIRDLVRNATTELSAQQNQTGALREHLRNLTTFSTQIEKFDLHQELVIDASFWNNTNNILTPLIKYMKNGQNFTVEEQTVSDCFDKHGRDALVKSIQDKVNDLVEQLFHRLETHFDVLTDEVAVKENDLYNLYYQLTVAGPENRVRAFYSNIFHFE